MAILYYLRKRKDPLPSPYAELSASIPSHEIVITDCEVELVPLRSSDKPEVQEIEHCVRRQTTRSQLFVTCCSTYAVQIFVQS